MPKILDLNYNDEYYVFMVDKGHNSAVVQSDILMRMGYWVSCWMSELII